MERLKVLVGHFGICPLVGCLVGPAPLGFFEGTGWEWKVGAGR